MMKDNLARSKNLYGYVLDYKVFLPYFLDIQEG
jgi:hypothetical protein